MASRLATQKELCTLGRVTHEQGKGVIEMVLIRSVSVLADEELGLLLAIAEASQCPVT